MKPEPLCPPFASPGYYWVRNRVGVFLMYHANGNWFGVGSTEGFSTERIAELGYEVLARVPSPDDLRTARNALGDIGVLRTAVANAERLFLPCIEVERFLARTLVDACAAGERALK